MRREHGREPGEPENVEGVHRIGDAGIHRVDVCAEVETTCLGAAMLGAAAVGADGVTDVKQTAARMSSISHTVEPQQSAKRVYRLAAQTHRQMYPALKAIFPLIAEIRHSAD